MHLSLTGFATIETSKLIVNTMLMLCAIDERGQEINMRDVNVPKALLLADAMDVSAAAQAIMAGKISECIGVFSRSGSSRRGLPEKAARAWLHAVVRCGAFDKELLRGARRDHAGLAGRVRDRVGRRVRRLPAGIVKGHRDVGPEEIPPGGQVPVVDAVLGAAGGARGRVFDALRASYRRDMYHLGEQLRNGMQQVINMHERDFEVGFVA